MTDMYLSNLSRQHRLLSVPLTLALVLSWCMLLCSGPLQASETPDHAEPAPVKSMPSCHDEPAPARTEVDGEPEPLVHTCPTCDAEPTPATGAGAPAMILSTLDWMQSLTAPPHAAAVVASLPPHTHPPPARLHLLKAVFLI